MRTVLYFKEKNMTCGLLVLLLAVLAVLGGGGVLVWRGGRRIVPHLRQRPEAVTVLAEHLILPLLGKDPKPEVTEVKGTTV